MCTRTIEQCPRGALEDKDLTDERLKGPTAFLNARGVSMKLWTPFTLVGSGMAGETNDSFEEKVVGVVP